MEMNSYESKISEACNLAFVNDRSMIVGMLHDRTWAIREAEDPESDNLKYRVAVGQEGVLPAWHEQDQKNMCR